MMSSIIDAAMRRGRTVLSLLIFLLIAGSYAYKNIPKESSPDIDIPLVYISMSLEGISPGDSERLLLRPMEQELSSIEGVKEIKSTGYTGDIRERLFDLQNNMISAILLVMVVMIAIMGMRAAGLVGIAIPSAFLSGVLIIYMMGLTVNVVVLFALILSIGMLVDGAVATMLAAFNLSS